MTEMAQGNQEFQFVIAQLRERGIKLDPSGRKRLNELIDRGRARAANEGEEDRFQSAVRDLANQLPNHFPPSFRIDGGKSGADAAILSGAFRSLCPMWPFC